MPSQTLGRLQQAVQCSQGRVTCVTLSTHPAGQVTGVWPGDWFLTSPLARFCSLGLCEASVRLAAVGRAGKDTRKFPAGFCSPKKTSRSFLAPHYLQSILHHGKSPSNTVLSSLMSFSLLLLCCFSPQVEISSPCPSTPMEVPPLLDYSFF